MIFHYFYILQMNIIALFFPDMIIGLTKAFLVNHAVKVFRLEFVPVRCAGMHQRWRRAYLKDLYHRRVMVGPDPLMARSSQNNWNYPTEISALSHRFHIPEIDHELIVQALTNKSFFQRKDIEKGASHAQPSKEDPVNKTSCNNELLRRGASIFRHILLTYLRAHWPVAPEEFIIAVALRLSSIDVLTETANHLGIQHVVRTGEFPPSEMTLHMALLSLIGLMDMDMTKARNFIREFFLPRLHDVPLEDVLPFRNSFHVLRDYMQKWEKVDDIEPRFINTGGLSTATPYYEIAIYANKEKIIGQSSGEQPWVALDLAAQNGLLKLWKVTDEPRVFPFKFDQIYSSRFEQAQNPNHSLNDVCSESTDIGLYTNDELAQDPIDPVEMAQFYYNKVRPEVGFPHRKRLRHMFHRGTIQRHSLRRLVKPQPHNI